MPTTWDEFFAAAEKVKKAGLIPVAHGGQNWQDFTTFEEWCWAWVAPSSTRMHWSSLTKGAHQPDHDEGAGNFPQDQELHRPRSPGRDWNLATAMVIKGKAAFQFMGDWAKGEFTAAGKVPGKDYICAAAPGTANASPSTWTRFAMFKLKDAGGQKAQTDLAAAIMGTEFQEVFNLNKGSIPVRLNMSMAKFDDCAKLSTKDFVATAKTGSLLPSIAHGMAVACGRRRASRTQSASSGTTTR